MYIVPSVVPHPFLSDEAPSTSPFLLSLADSLLSLSSPTRGKYQLLSTLTHHLPVTTLLHAAPTLPTELLSVMGHQALACHVRFTVSLACWSDQKMML